MTETPDAPEAPASDTPTDPPAGQADGAAAETGGEG